MEGVHLALSPKLGTVPQRAYGEGVHLWRVTYGGVTVQSTLHIWEELERAYMEGVHIWRVGILLVARDIYFIYS